MRQVFSGEAIPIFPFTAIVGQEDFKLCLILNLIDPNLGGVLASGDKGTGKTTTLRALSQLMGAEQVPFINLPLGATEDRVLGSIALEPLINEKRKVVEKGLLAQAHGGILYIDEVNLLNDYLMDVLLDAAASGGYYLEREGISQWLESRFCLAGTMNPEEGDLRPQLMDRFGLSVDIFTPDSIEERMEISSRRLRFDTNPEAFLSTFSEAEAGLRHSIINAKNNLHCLTIPEEVSRKCSKLAIEHKVEGMRADILLLKAARAYAAYRGSNKVAAKDVEAIAKFVLKHRSNSSSSSRNQENSMPEDKGESHTRRI
jgi:magnesium chelatase subunit D